MRSVWRFGRWLVGGDGRDAALAFILGFSSLGALADSNADPRVPLAFGAILVIAGTVPVAWRRRRPEAVLAVTVVANALYFGLDMPDSPAPYAVLVGLFTVAAHRPRRDSLWALGATGGVTIASLLVRDPTDPGSLVTAIALGLVAWSVGSQVRQRRLRSEDKIQRRLAEDRLVIARELHDVVAHGMSVMVVQAGAARTVLRKDPDAAEGSIRAVEETGRDSLAEMRRILGVLRGASDDVRERAPQPGVDDIPALVEASRSAGVTVDLEVDGTPRPLGGAVGLSAYRIAQEALTNVRRHAGRGATATVKLRYFPDRVEVDVRDDGIGANGSSPGHGLIGMRERAASLGGELQAGPGPEGGFVVRAVLPAKDGR